MKLVVATHNRDKLGEIVPQFSSVSVDLLFLDEFPEIGEIEETGTTLVENALIKARTVNKLTQLPAIADDTGLEVDSLDGAPGVYSARFSGEAATYASNVDHLLAKMIDVEDADRTAKFRTSAVYVDGSREIIAEGVIEGHITRERQGDGGFGYGPLFLPVGYEETFGQMLNETRITISHRALAFGALRRAMVANHLFPSIKETTT